MSHEHSQATDQLDEGRATATVTIRGLGLFCFNEQGAFDGGFLRQQDHTYMIEIREQGAGSASARWRVTNVDGDVRVEVVNPARPGSYRYESGDFDRASETGDERDFRWILDVEGPEMHEDPVETSGSDYGSRPSRLVIDAGTYYTKRISPETYARVRTDTEGVPSKYLGSIAEAVGAEIECADAPGSGLKIAIDGPAKTEVWLPRKSGVKYELVFANDCPEGSTEAAEGTDFRLIYDLIRDTKGVQYDLELAVDKDDEGASDTPVDDNPDKFRGGYGLVCDPVYFGKKSVPPGVG